MSLDAHARPPSDLRDLYKALQRHRLSNHGHENKLIDLQSYGCDDCQHPDLVEQHFLSAETLQSIFTHFLTGEDFEYAPLDHVGHAKAYTHTRLPGLTVIPGLLPIPVQQSLLDRLLHRDLTNPDHRTNVHFHHSIQYPPGGTSFFSLKKQDDTSIAPKDQATHRTMSIQQFLEKKLRWVTLGGQYDWTNKQYPNGTPPTFPVDVAELLRGLFPKTTAEAAILNLYSPGDTLSLHRDVSEQCGQGLISVSIGCECIFVIGLEGQQASEVAVISLRSGDVVYMEGASRFAWHGIPRVFEGTCPAALSNWPTSENQQSNARTYEHWKGWLHNKRINLNVRQMQ